MLSISDTATDFLVWGMRKSHLHRVRKNMEDVPKYHRFDSSTALRDERCVVIDLLLVVLEDNSTTNLKNMMFSAGFASHLSSGRLPLLAHLFDPGLY
ncbi:hypothetical protein TNCV_4781291 [Trichonephila clavipes]|nr:hypothetical protein TNCV_4781291 [Trichonephila clavipes]